MGRKSDDRLDYYATMLKKIRNKKYELLVISRIIHLLNDGDIEFTTQQLVVAEEKRFHLDLYFPQFKIAVEVDESYHSAENQVAKDKEREMAVIDAANVRFERIDASGKSFGDVCRRVDEVVCLLKEKKKVLTGQGNFVPLGIKYDSTYWGARKVLTVSDDARFRTHVDVANTIFGCDYLGHQKALIRLKERGNGENAEFVWFPKLYQNDDWDNKLALNGTKIVQTKPTDGKYGSRRNVEIGDKLVVFAHHKDEFGQIYYAFKGVFELQSRKENKSTYVRRFDELRFDGKKGYSFSAQKSGL